MWAPPRRCLPLTEELASSVTVTLSSFRVGYPEFEFADDSLINVKIVEAQNALDERVFGIRYDEAVSLMTAHKLAMAPGGMNARLVSDKGETTYNVQLQQIIRGSAGGPWAMGQIP